MELFTKISFAECEPKIDYTSKLVFMGSCFSENIGSWLHQLKFQSDSNLTGIIYNPFSMAKHIKQSLQDVQINENDLLKSRETHVHPDFHSSFNHREKTQIQSNLNTALSDLKAALMNCDVLFLTFGTAIAFSKNSSGVIVNNCHHLPAHEFSKQMMSDEIMLEQMISAIDTIHSKNANARIILSVSPIRHLRHGAIANGRSKARLIRLCEDLENHFACCTYLPVYEFVMDELRDYRFYRQDDFIHLNDLGINLIREKCRVALISKQVYPLMERIKKYNSMLAHKIQDADSEEATVFLKKIESEKTELQKLLPGRF